MTTPRDSRAPEPLSAPLDPLLDPTRIAGHGGIVDRIRQRTAGIGFDVLTIRDATDSETRGAALDRLTAHLRVIDWITTAALDAARDSRPVGEGLDVERLARALVIEGYPWSEQAPPGWRNRAEAERIAAEYRRLTTDQPASAEAGE